ncbi:MAG: metallophosphoesterase [Methylotenera sp.]
MKLHVLSDLHMEIAPYKLQVFDVDVIILAGDIAEGTNGIEWAASLLDATDAHIIYIAGNHEFYHAELNDIRQKISALCKGRNRLHYLENDEVIINHVRFLGATLWTDFNLTQPEDQETTLRMSELSLTDFRLIQYNQSRFKVKDAINMHLDSIKFIEAKLDEEFAGKTVIISHHAPALQSVAPKYKDSFLKTYFASDLSHLLDQSDIWIHGHTHVRSDYRIGKTRIICNPRGRPNDKEQAENIQFNPALIVKI